MRRSGGRSSTQHGISESRLMAQDSDLDDYDKAVGPSNDPLDTDSNDDEAGGNLGVLGMLYQFSRAQTEKGTGVHI